MSQPQPPKPERLRSYTEVQAVAPHFRLIIDHAPRCWRCDRVLIEQAARPWRRKCDKCNAKNASPPDYLAAERAPGSVLEQAAAVVGRSYS